MAAAGLLLTMMPAASASAPSDGAVSAAQAADIDLAAKARGWTYAQALAQHRAAEAVGALAEQVAAQLPDRFVGSALSERPGGVPSLYVKGAADSQIRTLVAAAKTPIRIVDRQPYSFAELEAREAAVHQALAAQGFDAVSSGVDFTNPRAIRADVTRTAGVSAASADAALARMPADLRSGVRLTVSDVAVAADEHAYGGMWVRDDGVNECTSGWAVRRISDGTTGVTTAGHCDGINQIVEPGVGVHALTHQAQHRGEWGDVEWKTSASHIEPAQFYASASSVRNVSAVEPRANITVGEWVCSYGRSSNVRDCSLDVENTTWSCTVSGVFNNRLVRMNGVGSTIGGDSGGGWSFGNTAYGSHKGKCSTNAVWSVADLYDEALGVRVRTA
ncbi:MAG: hypothetical protein ACRDT6_19865 [Micromonosporaceae bacterium]